MRTIFLLGIIFFMGSCIKKVKKDKEKVKISILEFSYSDSYEQILSFRVDSSKFYLIAINDTILYGTLKDSIFDRITKWQEIIMNNSEKFSDIKDCENCPEFVIKINSLQDTFVFVKHGQLDNDTKKIIQSTKVLYTKMKEQNIGQLNFETRFLIKPKPQAIVPVKF